MKLIVLPMVLAAWSIAIASGPASDASYDQVLTIQNRTLDLKVTKGNIDNGEPDGIKLIDDKTKQTLLIYSAPDASFFEKASIVTLDGYPRPLLLTEWNHGVHTVCLRIFEPEVSKVPAYEACSDGSIDYQASGDHISVTTYEPGSGEDQFSQGKRRSWRPHNP